MHPTMDSSALFSEIGNTFPDMRMPPKAALSFHKGDCPQCEYLRNDLEEYRGKEVTGDVIRYLHQELGCLSTDGLKWILPHYLKFCLTAEAAYNQMETEFMIYHLGPGLKSQEETMLQLSGLNRREIDCLIHFLEWCASHPLWGEYCPEDIERALSFVRTVKA